MKGYQISQYDLPLCVDGYLEVEHPDERGNVASTHRVGIIRVHLEEDTARLMHRTGPNGVAYSLMDVNRSGVPLMEIVSHPDITSPEEAQLYLMQLRHLLRWIGVSTGNMEEGAFRCDANVSVRPAGQEEFGTKVEVKNMNSFKSVRAALDYEIARQADVIRGGGRVVQETRGWDEGRGITVSQRSKEEAHDYRYFPEPDLPPLTFTPEATEAIRAELPELPWVRRDRIVKQYGVSQYEGSQLTSSREVADYFESAAEGLDSAGARRVADFLVNDIFKLLGETATPIESMKLPPEGLRELAGLVAEGTINRNIAKSLLPELFASGGSPSAMVAERGLAVVRDQSALEAAIEQAIADNPRPVSDYLAGKENALFALVGPVMKATRGQADANTVREMLKTKLEGMRGS
jgi:aspartyl-tRNA(Asn)/glutamyl-tRNA(Gln) amidotransferase subunit B